MEEGEEVEEGTWATAVARMTRIWGSSWLSHFLILRKTGNVLDQQPMGEEEEEEEEDDFSLTFLSPFSHLPLTSLSPPPHHPLIPPHPPL